MGVLAEDGVSRALVECGVLLQHMRGMFLHIPLLIAPCFEISRTVLEGLGFCVFSCDPCGANLIISACRDVRVAA